MKRRSKQALQEENPRRSPRMATRSRRSRSGCWASARWCGGACWCRQTAPCASCMACSGPQVIPKQAGDTGRARRMAEGRRKLMVRQRVLEHPDRASSHLCRLPFIHRKVTRARSRAKWRRGLVGIEFETASLICSFDGVATSALSQQLTQGVRPPQMAPKRQTLGFNAVPHGGDRVLEPRRTVDNEKLLVD
jgi:hypothetical protein